MEFPEPLPFAEALEKLRQRGVLPADFDTYQWSLVPAEIRERAFFSSQVESARLLQSMKDYTDDYLAESRDAGGHLVAQGRSEFVANMRELAIREGLGKVDAQTGQIIPEIIESDLTDIRSIARLQLIFDTQVESAQEFAYWKQGMDPDLLYVFPAQRFIRVRPVLAPRAYHAANEGVVKRKDDIDFWLSMNLDFGVPWGPWGFNSGMGVEDVGREEAEELGIIRKGERIGQPDALFNQRLQAGVQGMEPGIAAALARITGGTVAKGRIVARAEPKALAKVLESKSVTQALRMTGIKRGEKITEAQASLLIAELKETSPVLGTSKLDAIKGAKKSGVFTQIFIEESLDEFVKYLPPSLAAKLPNLTIEIKASLRGNLGSYNQASKALRLSANDLKTPAAARKTMTHELLHWVHDHGGPEVEKIVRDLWDARTAGERVVKLLPWDNSKVKGKRDKWMDADGDEYAGRIYDWEKRQIAGPKGTEVLTRHLEKLSDPALLTKHWNHASDDGKHWWRESFLQLLEILYL